MREYDGFIFACMPGCEVPFLAVAEMAYATGPGDLWLPPKNTNGQMAQTIVRHPADLLIAWHRRPPSGYHWWKDVPELMTLNRVAQADNPTEVLERYLKECPGAVGRAAALYGDCSAWRYEDMPWATVEFFAMLKLPSPGRPPLDAAVLVKAHTHESAYGKGDVDPKLRRAVARAEESYCEIYDYF